MKNKMSTLPPLEKVLRTLMNDRAFSLSLFVAFMLSLITNCLFLSVHLIRLQNKQNQPASCSYFIKITCNNKYYTQITMSVADYSKGQLKTVSFPV